MKIGMRKPSISKSFKSSTTGKLTRAIKSTTTPAYQKYGIIKNTEKAIYNKVHNKTTFSFKDLFKK